MTLTELNMMSIPASEVLLVEMMDVETVLSGINYSVQEFINNTKNGIKSFKDAMAAVILASKNKKALDFLNASIKHHIDKNIFKPFSEKILKLTKNKKLVNYLKKNLFSKLYNIRGWKGVMTNLSFIALAEEIFAAISDKIDEMKDKAKGDILTMGDILIESIKGLVASWFKKITHIPFKTVEKLFNALKKFKSYVVDIVAKAYIDTKRGSGYWVQVPTVQNKDQMLGKNALFVK